MLKWIKKVLVVQIIWLYLQPESKNPSKVGGRGARVFARAEIIPVKPDSDNTDVGITDTDKQRIVVKRYW